MDACNDCRAIPIDDQKETPAMVYSGLCKPSVTGHAEHKKGPDTVSERVLHELGEIRRDCRLAHRSNGVHRDSSPVCREDTGIGPGRNRPAGGAQMAEMRRNKASEMLSDASGRLDHSLAYNMDMRQWIWKSNQKCRKMGLFTHRDRVEALICLVSVLLSVWVSLHGDVDEMIKASIYLLAAGCVIGLDPMHALGLYLAAVTRYMILISDLMVIAALWVDHDEYRILTCVVCGFTIFYAIFLNKRVMRSENWMYSEAIQHALIADPENQSGEAWRIWGKVQCRSLYGQMGYPVDDEIIEGYAKPVFYLTYLKSKGNLAKLHQMIAQKEYDLEQCQTELEEGKQTIEHLLNKLGEYANIDQVLKRYEEVYKELRKENDQLRATNEELIRTMDEPETVIEVVKEADDRFLFMTEKERVFELFRRGYKNADITRLTGVKRSTVSDWKKKFEEQNGD